MSPSSPQLRTHQDYMEDFGILEPNIRNGEHGTV
jgi:hypothetical protein